MIEVAIAAALLVVAHTTPAVAGGLLGRHGAWPIDGGRIWRDGRPLLGRSKTWRGLALSLLATTAVAGLALGRPLLGAAFGALAMAGDLLSSFIKRRLGAESHAERPLVDQLPEFLLPLVPLRAALGIGWLDIAVLLVVFVPADIFASRLWDRLLDRWRRSRAA
jgi:hypothetical protein